MKTRLAEGENEKAAMDSEMAKLRRRLQIAEKQNEGLQSSVAAYEQERHVLEREVTD